MKILIGAFLAAVALAGCSLFQEAEQKTPDQIMQEKIAENFAAEASFSVFLYDATTEQQKSDVRAWLERQPGITEIVFLDKAAAYERFQTMWADDPEFAGSISADSLPETFRLRVADLAAIRAFRDGPAGAELRLFPGVRQVVYQCTTVEECRALESSRSAPATPSPRALR